MNKKLFGVKISFFLIMALALFFAALTASAEPWKFGVMGDTQWTAPTDPANANPSTVPISIINQINQQFINAGVKFVIEVGDLTDDGNDNSEIIRAHAAQPLIDAGIGFFPFRGNHETYGTNNNYGIPIFQSNYPQTQTGIFTTTNNHHFKLGSNFSSPNLVSMDLAGMSYSFDYGKDGGDARFVIIDPWATPSKVDNNADGYAYGYTINDQQAWISNRLDKFMRHTEHAFVFSHQPLIAENHQDTMFSGYTYAHPDWQNTFYDSLFKNDARYFISGHDHIHQRSKVKSPDGNSQVEEIISASNSSKFYTPKALTDSKWIDPVTLVNQKTTRETSLSQERYTPGYYIYTVDGPCVTVDYYSDNSYPDPDINHDSDNFYSDNDNDNGWMSDNCFPKSTNGVGTPQSCGSGVGSNITPNFNFIKKESWGYCQNGQEFLVPQTASYTVVQDSFEGTTAKILDGSNQSTTMDYTKRHLTKAVNTGWEDVDGWCEKHPDYKWKSRFDLASNIFKLLGLAELNPNGFTGQTDTYVLSLTYDNHRLFPSQLGLSLPELVSRDKNGDWVNAVDLNTGGTNKFVIGPYHTGYGLGTYGLDLKSRTVWAVINHAGDFAAAGFRNFRDN